MDPQVTTGLTYEQLGLISATRCRGNSASGGGRRTTVAYVINEASQGQLVVAESEALQSLREACEAVGASLETLHFGKLDFGETTVLDRFYNAVLTPCSLSKIPEVGLCQFWNSAKAEYFKNKKNFMLSKPD
ncbi:Mitogen-activated protein kinase kinase kinase 5 [Fukomys damarensis]|uniref:Mitogen-activated protein kinase kinase kinase 5 n=1 Tax=Fukomys damarensis TaxID=885580 RepID=A0A091EAH5_FUKDA|nr:Mitogen-activated protein kinase kinase kinase 5 [Fukomys damarensis]